MPFKQWDTQEAGSMACTQKGGKLKFLHIHMLWMILPAGGQGLKGLTKLVHQLFKWRSSCMKLSYHISGKRID